MRHLRELVRAKATSPPAGAVGTGSSPAVEVLTTPALDGNDTPTSAIAQGIISLSAAMLVLISRPYRCGYDNNNLIQDLAALIITIVNTMATVPDEAKPRRICAYHVYATETVIASLVNIRSAIWERHAFHSVTSSRDLPRELRSMVRGLFESPIHFAMAVLATPTAHAPKLAAEISAAVAEASTGSSTCMEDLAYAKTKRS